MSGSLARLGYRQARIGLLLQTQHKLRPTGASEPWGGAFYPTSLDFGRIRSKTCSVKRPGVTDCQIFRPFRRLCHPIRLGNSEETETLSDLAASAFSYTRTRFRVTAFAEFSRTGHSSICCTRCTHLTHLLRFLGTIRLALEKNKH